MNATASPSVIVLPRFSRCARASAGDSLNRTTLPSTTAVACMTPAYAKKLTDTSWQTVVVGDPLCAPFGRKPLAREQLEDVSDAVTGLPGLFAKRRLAVLLAANREIPEAAGPLVVRFQTLLERDD